MPLKPFRRVPVVRIPSLLLAVDVSYPALRG